MKRVIGWLWVGAIVVGGCSGSTSNGSSSSAPVAREQFPGELARAVCDNIGGCCQKAGFTYDKAKCAAVLEGVYGQLIGPKSQYDAQKGGDCVAFAKGVAQSCASSADPGPCEGVTVGTVPDGGQCQVSADCVEPAGGSVYCDQGVCVQEPRGKLGDGCSATCTETGNSTSCSGGSGGSGGSGSASCYTNDGLACGVDGKCGPAAKVGEVCSFGSCVSTAYCQSASSKCVSRADVGEACDETEQCVDGAYCALGKCVQGLPAGAACSGDEQCAGQNCSGGKCGEGIVSAAICSGNLN